MILKNILDRLPIDAYIASRYVTANMRQSLIIMLAVGIGVALIVFIPSINLSFFSYFLDKTVENSPHIRLTREVETMPRDRSLLEQIYNSPGGLVQSGLSVAPLKAPEKASGDITGPRILFSDQTLTRRRNIQAYRRLVAQIERFPGVVAVSPYVREQVIIVRGSQNRTASLTGIIPTRENAVTHLENDVVQGNLENMGPNDIFLGSDLADELNVSLGDRVLLITAYGQKSYKVTGIIKTGIYAQDLTLAYILLPSAQKLLNMSNQVSGVGIKIQDIYDAENQARLMAGLYNLKARSWMEENKIFLDQVSNFRIVIGVINFLIVFAAATSITSILIMVVASKSKEIGILKAMGASPSRIMRLFIIQGICLSLLGIVAGFFGAWGLITLYNLSPMAKGATILGVERPPTVMNRDYSILAIIYALISSMLASLFPAWRASRLDPVEAINQ